MQQFIIATPQQLIPGCLQLHHDGSAIVELEIVSEEVAEKEPASGFEQQLRESFQDYFTRPGSGFRLPLKLQGSAFQQRVWSALQAIEAGRVMAYGELAEMLHSSARAVGNACRRNPVPIIVPCHRVVAKSGIGGFAGATQGDHIVQKRRLLAHEGIML